MKYPLLSFEGIISLMEARFSDRFLNLGDLPHPYEFKEMEKAVNRILQAMARNESIVLVGDYDVDGVMATAIVSLFFEEIGYPLKSVIPNRFSDGYGLSAGILDRIDEADLIITVDNGIAAVEAADHCASRRIDLIITDHHIPPDTLPSAFAVVDQKQSDCGFPYKEICGAQIAWYLCAALNSEAGMDKDMKKYLDMVSIATIADMMPLININRAMVQAGLQQFDRSVWPFVRAYREAYPKSSYSSEDIAFGLSPLINSAGRLEDASIALDFVTSPDIYGAKRGLKKLIELNTKRREIEQKVTDTAVDMVDPGSSIIVVKGEGWHEGVVGIVAARLARKYERPAIVLSQNGDICKGSGRSWRDCHLYDLLSMQRDRVLKFGGHRGAIGMSLECSMFEEFVSALEENASMICGENDSVDPDIIGELPFELIDTRLMRLLERFEPFGQGNPRPKFITTDVNIASVRTMGENANHLRFLFDSNEIYIPGVQFKTTSRYDTGTKADIIYTLNENHFRGETSIQIMVDKIEQQ